jgi:hypothetical protein
MMKIIKMESDFMTIRTVTVSGVTAVYFDPNGTEPYFYAGQPNAWIRNDSTSVMYASLDENCTIGAEGTMKIPTGETALIELSDANKIYISGSGSAEIRTNNLPVNPFNAGGKGGEGVENPLNYLGVTTTVLSDGSSTNPILIDGVSVTAKKSDWVIYGSKDFIFNGTVWQEVGDFENYYTKTETDTLLSAKANAADVYTKAQSDDRYVQNADVVDTVTAQEIADSLDNIWEVN